MRGAAVRRRRPARRRHRPVVRDAAGGAAAADVRSPGHRHLDRDRGGSRRRGTDDGPARSASGRARISMSRACSCTTTTLAASGSASRSSACTISCSADTRALISSCACDHGCPDLRGADRRERSARQAGGAHAAGSAVDAGAVSIMSTKLGERLREIMRGSSPRPPRPDEAVALEESPGDSSREHVPVPPVFDWPSEPGSAAATPQSVGRRLAVAAARALGGAVHDTAAGPCVIVDRHLRSRSPSRAAAHRRLRMPRAP